MSSKKRNTYIFWGKVIGFTLLIMFFIRTFLFEAVTVSSTQMETALIEGDRVLINKTAYGIRMPITILSLPFTFDEIGGKQSYSTIVTLPYNRVFEKGVERNDIILFNNPKEVSKPLDKRELLLSRCVGLPGETIRVENGKMVINEKQYNYSPDVISEYYSRADYKGKIKEISENLNIPLSNIKERNDSIFFQLNKVEAYIINENLVDSIALKQNIDTTLNYEFIIPYKGQKISLEDSNINIYKQAILQENEDKAILKDKKLFVGGKELKDYTFRDNYYWVISDNHFSSSDSHSLGFIPFKNIIGRSSLIWHNSKN